MPGHWFDQSESCFQLFECRTITSPVCCSNKLPWEGPLLWPRPSAICCSRGTSTEVSHDRDCRSPGRSSSLSWEGSVVRSLRGRNGRRRGWMEEGRGWWGRGENWAEGVNTAVSSDTRKKREGSLNANTWGRILVLRSQTPLLKWGWMWRSRGRLLSEAVFEPLHPGFTVRRLSASAI